MMIQRVRSETAWDTRLTPEDFRALTPLIYGHISPYGTFPSRHGVTRRYYSTIRESTRQRRLKENLRQNSHTPQEHREA